MAFPEEADKGAVLRRAVQESRAEQQQLTQLQLQREHDLGEEWKRRSDAAKATAKEERQLRLARLRQGHEASMSTMSRARSSQYDEELTNDESMRELLEKYGDRLRVPRPPPASLHDSTSLRGSSTRSSPRKAGIPTAPRPRPGWAASAVALAEPSARHGSAMSGQGGSHGSGLVRSSLVPGQGPGAGAAEAAEGNKRTSQGHPTQLLPAVVQTPRDGIAGFVAAQDSSELEVPEPDRSLMPKKEQLRKKQQALLKKTEIVFYRRHMKEHFQKILQAVELTFADKSSKKQQASWNLAKPTIETDNLLTPGPRQP